MIKQNDDIDAAARGCQPLIGAARERGWGGGLLALLDLLEPLGIVGAQVLYAAAPTLGLIGARGGAESLARLCEIPGGIAHLREQLEPDEPA